MLLAFVYILTILSEQWMSRQKEIWALSLKEVMDSEIDISDVIQTF